MQLTKPGDVIGVLDDDDLWLPDKVRTVREIFRGPAYYFAHRASIVRGDVPTAFIEPENANGSMIVMRRDLLTSPKVRPFFDRLEWGCDPFLRNAQIASGLPKEISATVLSHIRYHESNSSHVRSEEGYRTFAEQRKRNAERYLQAWELIGEMLEGAGLGKGPEMSEAVGKQTEFMEVLGSGRAKTWLSYRLSRA